MSFRPRKILAATLAGVTLAGGLAVAAPAEAGPYGYRTRGGPPPVYVHRHRHRGDAGAALAAGVVGGLALGALAAQATRPAYGQPYLAPVQDVYSAPRYIEPRCWTVRRTYVDEYGDEVVTRRRVCE